MFWRKKCPDKPGKDWISLWTDANRSELPHGDQHDAGAWSAGSQARSEPERPSCDALGLIPNYFRIIHHRQEKGPPKRAMGDGVDELYHAGKMPHLRSQVVLPAIIRCTAWGDALRAIGVPEDEMFIFSVKVETMLGCNGYSYFDCFVAWRHGVDLFCIGMLDAANQVSTPKY